MLALLITIGNLQQTLKGSGILLSWSGPPVVQGWVTHTGHGWSGLLLLAAKATKIISGLLTLGLLWSLAGSGRLRYLGWVQLDRIRSPEPVIGIDGIFPLKSLVILEFTFFTSNITR